MSYLKLIGISITIASCSLISVSASAKTDDSGGKDYSNNITVDNLAELATYASLDGNHIKMVPGEYRIEDDQYGGSVEIPGVQRPWITLLHFSGSDNRFDLAGVTIQIDTEVNRLGNRRTGMEKVFVTGDNNILKGLKIEHVGDRNIAPRRSARTLHIRGQNNTIREVSVHTFGSNPYGYGSLLGKGGGNLVPVHKASSLLVQDAENTRLIDCRVVQHAFGHGIFIQGAVNTLIKDCHVEGEMRSTDDMLEDKSGPIVEADYMNRWTGERIRPGRKISLAEDGIRAYPRGQRELGSRTRDIHVVNCTVKGMRNGVALSPAGGEVTVENTEVTGCQGGFMVPGNAVIRNSRGDAKYGPVLHLAQRNDSDIYAEISVLPSESDFPPDALAYINGRNLKIHLKVAEGKKLTKKLPIVFCYSPMGHINRYSAENVRLINETKMPVEIRENAVNCMIETDGELTDANEEKIK